MQHKPKATEYWRAGEQGHTLHSSPDCASLRKTRSVVSVRLTDDDLAAEERAYHLFLCRWCYGRPAVTRETLLGAFRLAIDEGLAADPEPYAAVLHAETVLRSYSAQMFDFSPYVEHDQAERRAIANELAAAGVDRIDLAEWLADRLLPGRELEARS